MNNIPENCVECKSYNTCHSAHYLSLGCDYYDLYVERLIKDKEKREKPECEA